MSVQYDETKHPRSQDGTFTVKPASESETVLEPETGPGSLEVHQKRAAELATDIALVEQSLAKLREEQARHQVAAFVATLPPEAHEIEVIEWSNDAVNDHGSFDVTLGEVTDADGNVIDHSVDITISMRGDDSSPVGWAKAFSEADYPPSSLKVAAVRQWSAANQSPTGPQGGWSVVADVEAGKYRQGVEQFRDTIRQKFPTAHTVEFSRDYDELGETVSLSAVRDSSGTALYDENDAVYGQGDLNEHYDDLDDATSGLVPRYGDLPSGLQPESGGDDIIVVEMSALDDPTSFLGR